MSVKFSVTRKTNEKPVVSINTELATIGQKMNGKSLYDLPDLFPNLVNLGIAKALGGDFPLLVMEFPDRKVTVGFSRASLKSDDTVTEAKELMRKEEFLDYCFRVNKTMLADDLEGAPTGPERMNIGLPNGLGIVDEESFVETAAATATA